MLTELTFHGLDICRVEPDDDLVDFATDELTAGSALLFGQADEQIPVTAVRGLKYEYVEAVLNSGGVVRCGLQSTSNQRLA